MIFLLVLPLLTAPTSAITAGGCDATSIWTSDCASASTDGSSLTISGTRQRPGTDSPSDDAAADDGPAAPRPPSRRAVELAACLDDGGTTRCMDLLRATSADAVPDPSLPAVTMADLVSFAPPPVAATVEPGDVAIAGMPANFVSAASEHVATGSLFGIPVAVRFTPVAYDYSYGDGTTASLSSPGRSWSSLGQAQFSPTPTSHVYRVRGTYAADVDVRYSAEVDLGAGWQPVDGELRSDGPARRIRVFEARTALVAHSCDERPGAPGC